MKYLIICLIFVFNACGYKPLSSVTDEYLGSKVNVVTIINKAEPKDSINLNDNFTNYLEYYLHKSVDKNAKSKITLRMLNNDFIPLYYDELGYARSYKAIIRLEFIVEFKSGNTKRFVTQGEHIFNTNQISVLSDEQKSRAINQASMKAFNEFSLKILL